MFRTYAFTILLCFTLAAGLFAVSADNAAPNAAESDVKVPACLLNYKFGPEQYVLVVEKSTQTLLVFSNYQSNPLKRYTITTGKKNGRKVEEGDLKTPEGLYFFKRILSGEQLPKVDDYGEKAFTMNYPNPIDLKENRNGSGIWLHGAFAEDKTTSPNNSRGCVVMQNKDMVDVSKYIFLDKTPICIYETIIYDTVANIEAKRNRFIEALKNWKESWQNKDIEGYITHYADDFVYNGMNLPRFKSYKYNLNDRYKFIRVNLTDINLYGYNGYYVVMFNQLYVSDINHFYNKKIQYWRDFPATPKISAELTVPLPSTNRVEISKGNYVSIERFRRDVLAKLDQNNFTITPRRVSLENIAVADETIQLNLHSGPDGNALKVIPILRFESAGDSLYKSLEGIPLINGVPSDYSMGKPLHSGNNTMMVKNEKNYRLKSLTLFIMDDNNTKEQIVTYFINK